MASTSSGLAPSTIDTSGDTGHKIKKQKSQSLPLVRWVQTTNPSPTNSPESTTYPPITFLHFVRQEWALSLPLFAILFTMLALLRHWGAAHVWLFILSCVALVPTSKIFKDSVHQLALSISRRSPALSYGTRPDIYKFTSNIILSIADQGITLVFPIVALLMNEYRLAQIFVIGSVVNTITLVFGVAVFVGGLRILLWPHNTPEQSLQNTPLTETRPESILGEGIDGAQIANSLMMLACAILIIPSTYFATFKNEDDLSMPMAHIPFEGFLTLSRGSAILLFFLYQAFCFFQVRTHFMYFHPNFSGDPRTPIVTDSETQQGGRTGQVEEGSLGTILSVLLTTLFAISSAYISYCIISTYHEACATLEINRFFVGVVILPLLISLSDVRAGLNQTVAKNVGLCVGDAIRIVIYVVPVIVILGWITKREFSLYFDFFEIIVLFVSVILVGTLIMDGRFNYLEGLMLLTLYSVISLAAFSS